MRALSPTFAKPQHARSSGDARRVRSGFVRQHRSGGQYSPGAHIWPRLTSLLIHPGACNRCMPDTSRTIDLSISPFVSSNIHDR